MSDFTREIFNRETAGMAAKIFLFIALGNAGYGGLHYAYNRANNQPYTPQDVVSDINNSSAIMSGLGCVGTALCSLRNR